MVRLSAAIGAAVIGLVVILLLLPDVLRTHRENVRHITIAVSSDPSSAPIFVAQARGFFRREGIEATLLIRSTGKAALAAVFDNKAEFATVADTVLMFAALEQRDIASIATITESDSNHRIMALSERGISRPGDLGGKKIGVTRRTSGEYFLYTFLLFQGVDQRQVTVVDLIPEEMPQALEEGRVDAVATWYPTVGRLMETFGKRGISFEDHSYIMGWNIVGYRSFLERHPVTAQKLVRALIEARHFIIGNPEQSAAIVAGSSGTNPEFLKNNWDMYQFDVGLKDETIVNLEEQARWAISRYYPHRAQMPDFQRYFYPEALQEVDPAAVNIVTGRTR